MTGPPPLDRNGGIWRSLKRYLSEVIEKPNIMVQAFHFTTYNLSHNSWNLWMGEDELSLSRQINKNFSGANIFVDSGGYQFMQGDKIDLSKWELFPDQEHIYSLQLKYSPTQICNLDYPVLQRVDAEGFKHQIDLNIKNIKQLIEISKDNKTKKYLVVHGRNSQEIRYSYNAIKNAVDTEDPRIHFALGSQVPLMSANKGLAVGNANSLIDLLKVDFKGEKNLHIFGAGSQIIANLDKDINVSYDNSTFIRNAMYLKWYDPVTHNYEHFRTSKTSSCNCKACMRLEKLDENEIIDVISGQKIDSFNKSDVMALIALHNIFYERDRVANARRINSTFPINKVKIVKVTKKSYNFPFRGFKPRAPMLLLYPCSYKKPYSTSPSHKRIKKFLLDKFALVEFKDFETVTLSGLYGPVHWKDETKPEIISYDHRLTNMTSKDHLNYIRIRTAIVLSVISKQYESSFSVIRGVYQKAFGEVLRKYKVKTVSNAEELNDL